MTEEGTSEREEDLEIDGALLQTRTVIAGLESTQYPDENREHHRLLALEKLRSRADSFASTKAITYLARRVRRLELELVKKEEVT